MLDKMQETYGILASSFCALSFKSGISHFSFFLTSVVHPFSLTFFPSATALYSIVISFAFSIQIDLGFVTNQQSIAHHPHNNTQVN